MNRIGNDVIEALKEAENRGNQTLVDLLVELADFRFKKSCGPQKPEDKNGEEL